MSEVTWLQQLSRRIGGPRFLALPFLRGLAVVAGFVWLALTPTDFVGWILLAFALAAFAGYSVFLYVLIWFRPRLVFRLHLPVLLIDLAFALLLIRLSGGAESTLFLALLLIAGLQSYYYGIRRGVVVAVGASIVYLWVVWPTLIHTHAGEVIHHHVADVALRIAVLVGTALGIGVLADIEERERLAVAALNREVQARERFITNVVESLRDGLVVLDPEGRVRAWNRAMVERYDVQPEEVLGQKWLDVFPNMKREGLGEPIERLLRGEIEEFALEGVEHETLKKGRVILNLKGSLLRENLAPAGAVLLVEDITEKVALERSARQAEKLAALGTLSAGLAHELNNPIGIISSRIDLMLQEAGELGLPPQVRQDLEVLHRHSQRVARIARGLLSFARQSPGDRGLLDLNGVVEDTLLLLEKQVSKEGIAVRRSLAPDLPPMQGDPNALQQVVLNLLTNARDAMRDGGEIRIETGTVTGRPGWLRLVVADNGPGIPLDRLPKIFDPFYTTKAQGTGLGLSVSYGIVREHQGTIDVQSRPGKGTTFTLTFPVVVSEDHA